MSSTLMAKRYFRDYKLIASKVGVKIPFLKQTSCMSSQKRTEIAACQAFREHFSQDPEFNAFLKDVAEPTLAKLGFAEWPRDILTDMGLRVGEKGKRSSLRKLRE